MLKESRKTGFAYLYVYETWDLSDPVLTDNLNAIQLFESCSTQGFSRSE